VRVWAVAVTAIATALVAAAVMIAARRGAAGPRPGRSVEGLTDVLSRGNAQAASGLSFVDATRPSGIDFRHGRGARSSLLPEDMGSGAAWGDYDGDGDEDLYLVGQPGPLPESEEAFTRSGRGCGLPSAGVLYRNNGDATFSDVTTDAGVPGRGWGMGATWADYDGDADLDLFLTGFGCSTLYRNDGGAFREATSEAGLDDPGFAAGAAWGDVDADGDLDLYVAHYVAFHWKRGDASQNSMQYGEMVPFTLNPSSFPAEPNRLYINQGGGRFREKAASLGAADPNGRGLQPVFSDLDLDGDPDIYVANDVSANALLRNDRGRFTDASSSSWSADYRGAMGLAVADEDGDGDFDLFITHWIAQENALYRSLLLEFRAKGEADPLKFTDVADMTGLGAIALNVVGWGASFSDFDDDGRLDLLVVNGHTLEEPGGRPGARVLRGQRPFLFWNAGGDRGYFEVGDRSGEFFRRPGVLRGAAAADYDGDGDEDAVVVENHGSAILLRNESAGKGRFLNVRLRGRAPNTYAVGAKVRVTCGGVTRIREVAAGGSYLSMHGLVAHFGLGACAVAERVEVVWPSGAESRAADVPADQVLDLREPERPRG